MNHGYCVNCWWYKTVKGKYWIATNRGPVEKLGNGKCYMHNGGNDVNVDYSFVEGECYCPDYYNRNRGNREQKKTLEEWINSSAMKYIDTEKLISKIKTDLEESEKPLGLEEEINRLWESFADEMEGPHNLFDIYARLARHFAKWGAEHLADNKVVAVKLGDEIAINGYKLAYDKNENAIRVVKVEPNGSPEIQNDLVDGGTKAVRLPDGRYVTEKLARELEEEIPNYNELADYSRRLAEELLIVVRKYEFLSEELAEELRTHFMSMFLEGTVWQKEQMMKDAVEAHIYQSANPVSEIGHPLHQAALLYEDKENAPYLKAGDRVKLIIVKED